MWTDEMLVVALTELRDDPESRGYATMSDQEAAEDMGLKIWVKPLHTFDVAAASIAARVPIIEQANWRNSASPLVQTTWEVFMSFISSGGTIRADKMYEQAVALGPDGANIFSQATIDEVVSIFPKYTRAEILGLPVMTSDRVAYVRGYING